MRGRPARGPYSDPCRGCIAGKQRYREAAAFFVLADALDDAVNVCVRNLKDVQLAIVVCRMVQGDDSPLLKELLAAQLTEELCDDPVGQSMVHWLNKNYHDATKCLLDYRPTTTNATDATAAAIDGAALRRRRSAQVAEAPMVLNLCRFLQQHQHVKRLNSAELDVLPHVIFHRAYQSYLARGLSLLALDTLADYHDALQHHITTAAAEATAAEDATGTISAQATADAIASGTFDFGAFGGFDDGFPDATPAPVVAKAPSLPPPPRAPTSVFGGLMAAKSKATPTSATTTAAIHSGTFDFGSFGGFDDEFSQFDKPAADNSADVDDGATAAAMAPGDTGAADGGEDPEESVEEATKRRRRAYKFSTTLVRMRQYQLCADVVTRDVVRRAVGTSWAAFRRALLDDARVAATILRLADTPTQAGNTPTREYASRLFFHVYRSACALDLVRVQCLVRPYTILHVLERLTNELVCYITTWAHGHAPHGGSASGGGVPRTQTHSGTGGAPSDARARHVVEHISTCLLQLTRNLTDTTDMAGAATLPSAMQLAEYTLVAYGALVVAAWKHHDSMRLLQLQLNAPGARMWNHLCAGVSSAKGLAELCRQRRRGVRTPTTFAVVGVADGAPPPTTVPLSPLRGGPPTAMPTGAIKVTPTTTTPTDGAAGERACHALVTFLDRAVDETKWMDVDVGAKLDEEGNVLVTTYAKGTPELQAEQVRCVR